MRFVVSLIVLSLPVLDVLATMRFARWRHSNAGVADRIRGFRRGLVANEASRLRAKTLAALRGTNRSCAACSIAAAGYWLHCC
jgi:hypothetical protein